MPEIALAQPELRTAARPQAPVKQERMLSLDVFRGVTIAGMILVNNAGNWNHIYAPLKHAQWHGWTMTDLVFPFFLFIVGVSMTLSFARRRAQGDSRWMLFKQVIRRSLIIFGLGLFLGGFPFFDLATIRIPGVLQRIALCYFFAAAIYLTTRVRGQIVATMTLLGLYWILMTSVPVPGHGPGPGKLQVESNLAAYIDNALLHGHLYRTNWDPEGILSTLPAIASVLFGILAGQWLRVTSAPRTRILGLFAGGFAGVTLGLIMDLWFPINKNLWTSSYAVFTAGLALFCLGACYWIVDVMGYQVWAKPFVVFGMNAIAVYVLSGLVSKSLVTWKVANPNGQPIPVKTYLYEKFFAHLASPINASLLWAFCYVALWLGIMWILYRRRIFIKI